MRDPVFGHVQASSPLREADTAAHGCAFSVGIRPCRSVRRRRGAPRLVAVVATRSQTFADADLRPADLAAWRSLRQQLQTRQAARRARRRFRQDPDARLSALEQQLAPPALPP